MGTVHLRDWLAAAEERGYVQHVSGAHWDLEMSSISELVLREGEGPPPALLFDRIPGYPDSARTLFGLLTSGWGIARALGLPEDQTGNMALLRNWYRKRREMRPIKPLSVASGPVMANTEKGGQIDLLRLPVPRFHELDRSRYIGTCHAVIQRDPDTGYINLGAYRNMLVDRDHIALHILAGQHGNIIAYERYAARKQRMPVAVAIGIDPALWFFACHKDAPWGVSEYEYAGGVAGEPVEVFEGPVTGLPLPAHAEIVIEGEWVPGNEVDEGPFGEWHGYYANMGLQTVPEPLIDVKAVYYRDNPILTCSQMAVPPHGASLMMALSSSAGIWNRLESFGIPGIKGVWSHEAGSGILFHVISVEQLYSGHARQVGVVASQYGSSSGAYTVVVEDDIDPSNLKDVVWAMATRALPDRAIHVIPSCRASNAHPAIPLSEKAGVQKPLTSARVIIEACRDLSWKQDWYPMAKVSAELRKKTLDRWRASVPGLRSAGT